MDQPSTQRHFPWSALVAIAILTVVMVIAHHNQDAPWWGFGFVILAVTGLFLVGRWLAGGLWGFLMALMLGLHPLYLQESQSGSVALEAEALKLVVLAGIFWTWRQTFLSTPRAGQLLLIGLLLAVTGEFAWLTSPHAGWVATLTSVLGLLLGFLFALTFRRSRGDGPSRINLLLAAGLTLLVPVGALVLALAVSQATIALQQQNVTFLTAIVRQPLPDETALRTLLEQTVQVHWPVGWVPGFDELERERWGWPGFWPVAALMLLGLARSGWRGWLQWSRREPPLAWLLTLFVLVVASGYLLNPLSFAMAQYLPLATLAVMLCFFGVGDWVFGVGERIRLAPPDEESSRYNPNP